MACRAAGRARIGASLERGQSACRAVMAAARALFLRHGKFCMRYGGQVQPRQPWHSQNGAPGAALAISQRVAGPWERKMCTTGGFYTGECSKCARVPAHSRPGTVERLYCMQQEDTWSMQQRTQKQRPADGT